MTDYWLYYTTVPVLLGSPRRAGRVAAAIRLRHELKVHWFGRGRGLLLPLFARRHPIPAVTDGLLTLHLRAFSDELRAERGNCLPALIPCSPEAEAYVERNRAALEECYLLLPPADGGDPLAALVKE